MGSFLMNLGIVVLFVGTTVSIIVLLVFAIKRKKIRLPLFCIFLCIFLGIFFLDVGSSMWEKTDEYKRLSKKKAQTEELLNAKTTNDTQKIEKNITEDTEIDLKNNEPVSDNYSFESNGFRITINKTDTDFKDYDNEYGWNTPQDGMKYVMVSLSFENIGSSDGYVGIDAFDCYADNELCEQVYTLDDNDFINANLSSGRKVSFNVYYSVPISADSIELEYETNYWNDKKEIIKIQ